VTDTDLDRIEAALDVALPRSYRELMVKFPIPALAGNCDTDIWDHAGALIEQNLRLRSSKRGPWPDHFYFFGDPMGGSGNAIDLRDPAAPVWMVEHCDLSAKGSGPVAPSFEKWASAQVVVERNDLVRDGIDPDRVPY
jgi:hypothetical protein